jgi:hypothetical protein
MQNYLSSLVSNPFQGFAWPHCRNAKTPCSRQKISRIKGNDQIGHSVIRSLQYELVIRVHQLWPQSMRKYALAHPSGKTL